MVGSLHHSHPTLELGLMIANSARSNHTGDLLRKARAERGLTQEDLAGRFPGGISVDTVSNIERGRVRPRRHTLVGLLDVMGVEPPEQERILEAWRSAGAASHATPALEDDTYGPMPVPLTPVIGRDRELGELEGLILNDSVRILTLTGPGGVGKTRLATAVAGRVSDRFSDGVRFVDLTPLREPAQLLTMIALRLGLADAGDRPAEERLVGHLMSKHLLLLLDNSETAVAAAGSLVPLLQACPSVKVLATSREALRLRGEQVYPVAPLVLPPDEASASLESLARVPSLALLSERARMASPAFALSQANAGAMVQICRRLDGLPLALELAAARLRHMSPELLAGRLEKALAVLVEGPRDLPERQQALRATIDWSHQLLTPREQQVLRRLSVFRGGCTATSAVTVCAGTGRNETDAVLASLDSLLEKSLLTLREDGDSAEPRYVMLETIREYAGEQLERSSEEGAVRDRHARVFSELAEASFAPLYSARRLAWMATLKREWGNLHAALAWCLDGGGDFDLGMRLAGSLGRFWYFTGNVNEGRAWLAKALVGAGNSRLASANARCFYAAGKLAWVQGDYEAALAAAHASIEAAAELNDRAFLGECLNMLGYTLMSLGQPQEALAAYSEGLKLERDAGATWQVALTLVMMSEPLRMEGRVDHARACLEEGLATFRELEDTWGQGVAHAMTAMLVADQGDLESMERIMDEAESIFDEHEEEKYGIVRGRLMRAYFNLRQGRPETAAIHLKDVLGRAMDLGQTPYILVTLAVAGAVAMTAGMTQTAASLFGAASPLLEPRFHVDDGGSAARAAMHSCIPELREALGGAAFDAAWSEGKRMPLYAAVDLGRNAMAQVMDSL